MARYGRTYIVTPDLPAEELTPFLMESVARTVREVGGTVGTATLFENRDCVDGPNPACVLEATEDEFGRPIEPPPWSPHVHCGWKADIE